MSLFGKKREETKVAPACTCNGNAVEMEAESMESGICCIKVLGSGCKSCHTLYENVKETVIAMNLNIETEYVTDMEKVVSYGVMSTPALVVNEKVISMGKVLKPADIEKLFHKLGF
ncbi:MAG: thioredoxin family protein [Hespellia sp.]|nr:thioredoxin family protein [Hespellia sp.]